jgi:hypothetical protein
VTEGETEHNRSRRDRLPMRSTRRAAWAEELKLASAASSPTRRLFVVKHSSEDEVLLRVEMVCLVARWSVGWAARKG